MPHIKNKERENVISDRPRKSIESGLIQNSKSHKHYYNIDEVADKSFHMLGTTKLRPTVLYTKRVMYVMYPACKPHEFK